MWLWGACVVAGGACVVAGGHAWLLGGGIRGCQGGMHGCGGGVHRIRRDTVKERAVRILLECILVCLNVIFLLESFILQRW